MNKRSKQAEGADRERDNGPSSEFTVISEGHSSLISHCESKSATTDGSHSTHSDCVTEVYGESVSVSTIDSEKVSR